MITGAWAVEAAIKCMTFTLLQELQREWLDQSVGKICSKGGQIDQVTPIDYTRQL